MLRNILGVIAGYIAMAAVVMISLTVAYMAMGTEGAFAPASYAPSMLWIVVMFIVSLVAAVIGGLVCKMISRNQKAVIGLIIVVLVLGIFSALPSLSPEERGPRTGELSNMEAMQQAQQPVWVAFLIPLIGMAGVWVGGSLKKDTTVPSQSQPRAEMA